MRHPPKLTPLKKGLGKGLKNENNEASIPPLGRI